MATNRQHADGWPPTGRPRQDGHGKTGAARRARQDGRGKTGATPAHAEAPIRCVSLSIFDRTIPRQGRKSMASMSQHGRQRESCNRFRSFLARHGERGTMPRGPSPKGRGGGRNARAPHSAKHAARGLSFAALLYWQYPSVSSNEGACPCFRHAETITLRFPTPGRNRCSARRAFRRCPRHHVR